MGKNKKKKKKRLKYNKHQFISILCRGCSLCGDYLQPNFCFDCCYKSDPLNFINYAYKSLVRLKNWPEEHELTTFERTFCSAKCCVPEVDPKSGSCKHLLGCANKFREQLERSNNPDGELLSIVPRRYKKKKKNRVKEKTTVVQPYPTFLTSDNPIFKARIKYILYGEKAGKNKDS